MAVNYAFTARKIANAAGLGLMFLVCPAAADVDRSLTVVQSRPVMLLDSIGTNFVSTKIYNRVSGSVVRIAFHMAAHITSPATGLLGQAIGGGAQFLMRFTDNTNNFCVFIGASGGIGVTRMESTTGSTRTVAAVGVANVNDGVEHHVEIEFTLGGGTSGSVKTWIDGVADIDQAGIDTQDTGTSLASMSNIQFSSSSLSTGADEDVWIGDVLVWDDSSSGTSMTGELPNHDHSIGCTKPIVPADESNSASWLPTPDFPFGENAANVSDNSPDAGAYVETMAPALDLYLCDASELAANAFFTVVVAPILTLAPAVGGDTVLFTVAGPSTYASANFTLNDSGYHSVVFGDFYLNPASGLPWGGTIGPSNTLYGIQSGGGSDNVRMPTFRVYFVLEENYPPDITLGTVGNTRVNEDATISGSSITDREGGDISVLLFCTNCVATLAGTTGLTFVDGDGTADGSMEFSGSIADCTTAITTITATPDADFIGTASIRFTAIDDGPSITQETISWQVAENSAPFWIINSTGATTLANNNFTATGRITLVDDVDDETITVTITAAHCTFTLADVTGLTFTVGDGTADASMAFTGLPGAINDALASVLMTPQSNYAGTMTLTFTAADPALLGFPETLTVAVTNEPPEPHCNNSLDVVKGTSAIMYGFYFEDAENSGTYTVDLIADNGRMMLLGTVAVGVTFALGDAVALHHHINMSGTISALNNAISQLAYRPDLGFVGSDSILFSVSDQMEAESVAECLVTVTAEDNVAPVITVPTPHSQYAINDVVVMPDITFVDTSNQYLRATISLALGDGTVTMAGTDDLSFVTGTGTDDTEIVVRGTGETLTAGFATLTFTPSSGYSGPVRITVTATDLIATASAEMIFSYIPGREKPSIMMVKSRIGA